jgi:gamma-glutamylputrescine oxidase
MTQLSPCSAVPSFFHSFIAIMLSYWERQSFLHYNRIVVGAGIVGLSAALALRDKFPADRILVLERGLLPTGASTRNAGFACAGSVTELLDDLTHSSEEEVVALFARRLAGLRLLREKLGDARIGYRERGAYELIDRKSLRALEKIDYLNDLLRPVLGKDAFRDASTRPEDFGFNRSDVLALIDNLCEGELHSGMLLRALMDAAMDAKIEVHTGTPVSRFEEDAGGVTVFVEDVLRGEELPLRSTTLCLCTNAFTKALLPDSCITPGRGQVILTEPIADLKFQGIFHYHRGYYYFREIDGRVLFGGGRHLDFSGEESTDLLLHTLIQSDLEEKLRTVILPNTPFKIAQRWSGIMAFGETKEPIVRAFSDRVFGAFRCGGMGVALGMGAAEEMVEFIHP